MKKIVILATAICLACASLAGAASKDYEDGYKYGLSVKAGSRAPRGKSQEYYNGYNAAMAEKTAAPAPAASAAPAPTPAAPAAHTPDFVKVPGGKFTMGRKGGDKDELPLHIVEIDPFIIGATEVTIGQYISVIGKNPTSQKNEKLPVFNVSWYDAVEYCNALSKKEGLVPAYKKDNSGNYIWVRSANGWRLPTEAEWEYAARSCGKDSFVYSGSDNIDDVAWYKDNSDSTLRVVAKKKPNSLGLYDMSGNVCEWIWDLWGNKTYSTAKQNNPTGISYPGKKRSYRGGDVTDPAKNCDIGHRDCQPPEKIMDSVGFRVVRSERPRKIPEFVLVEGGKFNMGSDKGDADVKPVHTVAVSSFYIGATEVTQAQYESVMKKNPSYYKYVDDLPITDVTWYDAVEFCNALSKMNGYKPCYSGDRKKGYTCDFKANGWRLPTEAEWEYAANGGNTKKPKENAVTTYSGSNNLFDVAWAFENSDCPRSVATLEPNSLGIYDMSGNVSEWCWDWWGSKSYAQSDKENPTGVPSGKSKILRGGRYESNNPDAKEMGTAAITERGADDPTGVSSAYGFRIVRNAK